MMSSFGEDISQYFKNSTKDFAYMLRYFVIAAITGVLVGAVSTAFSWCDAKANAFRAENPWILYFLPLAGIIIVFLYHRAGVRSPRGTNLVLSTLQAKDTLPVRMAPLIFISTIITHLCGGSVGREGAALQLGGAIGASAGALPIRSLDENDRRMIIMCGMSAAFSAIFGTPIAAAIFPMEVISVGILQYSALFPCFISSYVASNFALFLGFDREHIRTIYMPEQNLQDPLMVVILSLMIAVISVIFVLMLKHSGSLFSKITPNRYIQVIIGGVIMIAATRLLGTTDYNGAGMDVIERAVKGDAVWYAFILKMILTAVCIGSGYKGGEIVPSLFIGATFGAAFANIVGMSPALAAACGMAAMFCGVTNCPIATLLITCELFGFHSACYFLLAIATSYVMSGYFGLYSAQRIMYSKFRTKFINKTADGSYDDFSGM